MSYYVQKRTILFSFEQTVEILLIKPQFHQIQTHRVNEF